jgi:hypothetical protein
MVWLTRIDYYYYYISSAPAWQVLLWSLDDQVSVAVMSRCSACATAVLYMTKDGDMQLLLM